MKKTLLILALALVAVPCVNAQNGYDETKHELALSRGILSNSQWIDIFSEVVLFEAGAEHINGTAYGPFTVEYLYRVKNWLAVGGMFTYGTSSFDIYMQSTSTLEGTEKNRYFTVMPAVKFDWLRTAHFGMYSKLAFGYTYRSMKSDFTDPTKESETDAMGHLNWQVSPLGIEAGFVKVRGFAELGIGEQGVFIFGLRWRL